jgi:predicted nucleic acid-binding protein
MPVERIEHLPAGTRLFLDANIFVYAFFGHSNQCRELLGRCATEQILGITTLDVVNEVTHRMMLAEALGSGVIKRDRVRDLRGKWRQVAKLTEYWTQTSAIFVGNWDAVDYLDKVFSTTTLKSAYYLLPREGEQTVDIV